MPNEKTKNNDRAPEWKPPAERNFVQGAEPVCQPNGTGWPKSPLGPVVTRTDPSCIDIVFQNAEGATRAYIWDSGNRLTPFKTLEVAVGQGREVPFNFSNFNSTGSISVSVGNSTSFTLPGSFGADWYGVLFDAPALSGDSNANDFTFSFDGLGGLDDPTFYIKRRGTNEEESG